MYSLCCISNELKKDGHSFKTMTWKRFNELRDEYKSIYAMNELGSRWLNNIEVTAKIIEHCGDNNWNYRLSSDLFPCLTHPEFYYKIQDVPQYIRILQSLIGIAVRNNDPISGEQKVRLSCHPDQFNVLASENANAVQKTIKELHHHAWVMDQLMCEKSYKNPINIHVNCNKGNLKEIAERFNYNLSLCFASVRNRLVVENEDKGVWNVENLYQYFYVPYGIPITFDNLHHQCNPGSLTEDEAMKICASTWYNIKPLFHYSESDPNNKNKRAHADYPTNVPPCEDYDWEIELKEKDFAIRQLHLIELTMESQKLNLY